jgi:hypothetical protein
MKCLFKVKKKKKIGNWGLQTSKIYFKKKREIKAFSAKQRVGEFSDIRPILQKMFKKFFQAEELGSKT